ncbi:MAG TPA: hypothetical protein VND93_29220, partial [Myxococcales bacterium]|nr:hypothetical protein [Myxococcales bacterium]
MEHFFTSMSKRQTMLLLTGVTFSGQEALASFDFLGEYEAELLKFRAGDLLQIPREKRIPLLVQEIKRLVTTRPTELFGADPVKLAEVLRGERAATREILIAAFPEALAAAVRVYLPPPPQPRPAKKPRPELLPVLRWRLEEVLRQAGARRAHFKFSDVLLLQTRELLTLADHMGARALAPAMAGLVTADREEFLGRLPPDLKRLAERAIEQSGERKMADADAKDLIALHAGERGGAEVVRSAGAQRLARACLAQSPEFAARLVERQRGEFGGLLVRWVREERATAVNRGDGGRTEIVEELESLEQQGLISKPLRMPAPPKKAAPPPRGADRAAQPGPAGPPPARAPAPPARSPSQQIPLAAQARGASASAQFRAAAEAAAPKQSHANWMAEREKRKAGMSSQWNMPRPIQGGASEPAITIPPHLVKRSAPVVPAPAEKTPPDEMVAEERTTPPQRASSPGMKDVAEELTGPPQRSRPQLSA